MHRIIIAGLLLLSLTGGLLAQESNTTAQVRSPEAEQAWRKGIEDKLPFMVGETLEYHIYWGLLYVGRINVVAEWMDWAGSPHIAFKVRTRSNAIIDALYPIDDYIESIIDPETLAPVRFTKNLNEGRRKTRETTHFDRTKLRALWFSRLKNRKKEYDIKPDTKDILSFMYFLRSEPFVVGKKTDYQVMADEKIYDLHLNIAKQEDVKLKRYGKVSSTRIEPTAAFDGLFIRKGKMTLWVSRDARQVATKIVADTPFANLVVKLHEIGGPGEDFWINPKQRKVYRRPHGSPHR